MRKTDVDVIQRYVWEKYKDTVSLDVSTYSGSKTKARFIDKEYGEWWACPYNVLRGHRHPKRVSARHSKRMTLPASEIQLRIKEIHGDTVTLDLTTYTNTRKRAKFIDKEYGAWWTTPNDLIRHKCRHPLHGHTKIAKSKTLPVETIRERVKDLYGNTVQLDVSTYKNTMTKARFVHDVYGEWWALPSNMLRGQSHPDSGNRNSKPQRALMEWIRGIGVAPEESAYIENSKREIDIWIPDANLGIEYHGLYWHSDKFCDKSDHLQKRRLCEENGIRLLQFFSDEVELKLPIVQSIIESHLKINQTSIYARKCAIKQVKNRDAQTFLHSNHLMGAYRPARYIGLFHKDQLISLLGYKKSKNIIEISRFCNALNHSVPGGLSKLLKYVEKEENPDQIVSWVDLRYGNGSSLEKIGFKRTKETLGWRWTDRKYTYNRLKCRANMDSRNLTQKQHAEELGWDRVYDAG